MFKSYMLKSLFLPALFIALFSAFMVHDISDASAQSLNDLRLSGQVGEGFDGYARARDNSVKSVVDGVNQKRRAIYQERAQQQGIPADQVGQVYAEKIKAKAPAGTWLLSPNGSWRQK